MSYSNQSWAFYASKNCQKVLFQTLKEAVDINRAILRCISYKNLLLIKEKKKHDWEIWPFLFCFNMSYKAANIYVIWSFKEKILSTPELGAQ
jgi:hypothetical protein